MQPAPHHRIRIARPTRDMDAAVRFWRDGVGLPVQGRKSGEETGHELAFIGWPDAAWHPELVADPDLPITPTDEDLLVVYVAEPLADETIDRIVAAGGVRVRSRNAYWDDRGVTFVDPDGYRLVLTERSWG